MTRPVEVYIRTQPVGATIRIDNQVRGQSELRLKLRRGSHSVQASLNGYQPKTLPLNVRLGRNELIVSLDRALSEPPPVEQSLQISSDVAGRVFIDDAPPAGLTDGQFSVNALPWGPHKIKIESKKGAAEFSLQTAPRTPAEVTEPLKPGRLSILIISTAGGQARIYGNSGPAQVRVDGEPKGDMQSGQFDLTGLADGTHQLELRADKDEGSLTFTMGGAPAVIVSVTSGQNAGELLVLTGIEGVMVSVDEKPRGATNSRGQKRIPALEVGDHAVSVSKDGYQAEQPRKITITKGKQESVEFNMRPEPTESALSMQGFPADAVVTVDNQEIGKVSPDGSFAHGAIKPGERVVGLRHRRYKPVPSLRKSFGAGQQVVLRPQDFRLESLFGSAKLEGLPALANVMVGRPGGPKEKFTNQELEEGQYTFSATAPDYEDAQQTVHIIGGQTVPVALRLVQKRQQPPTSPKPHLRIEDWAKSAGWKLEGGWYVVTRGQPYLFPETPLQGTITFQVYRKGSRFTGRKPVRWVSNFIDQRNYVAFEIDGDSFRRIEYVDGKETKAPAKPLRARSTAKGSDVNYRVGINISSKGITHQIYNGKSWEPVDAWAESGRDYSKGKFGFFLPKKTDEMLVSHLTLDREQ